MVFEQIERVKEDKWGEVEVEIRVADTYNDLGGTATATKGLLLKRVQRSLAEDGLKVNTIVDIDYYADDLSSAEANTLNLLKSGGYVRIRIGTSTSKDVLYLGRISSDYEREIVAWKGKKVEMYRFTSQPVSRGFFAEVKVGDVIDKFTTQDWGDLIDNEPYGVGRWSDIGFDWYIFKYPGKTWYGSDTLYDRGAKGYVANLMALNQFLNVFCNKIAVVVQEKYGINVNVVIPNKGLGGYFFPRYCKVSNLDFGVEKRTDVNYYGYEVGINSSGVGASFYVDAGLFLCEAMLSVYKMENTWTNDNNARRNEHLNFVKEKIFSLSLEQFFHRLGANFGLITMITTNDDINYEVKFFEPSTYSNPYVPISYVRPKIKVKSSESKKEVRYVAYFSYMEDEAWNEYALVSVWNGGSEFGVERKNQFYTSFPNNVEILPLFWGFFPSAVVSNPGKEGIEFMPNTFMLWTDWGDVWQERSNVFFQRMLWIKGDRLPNSPNSEPSYYWMPVYAWQVKSLPSNPSLYDFLAAFRFYMSDAVSGKVGFVATKEIDFELPGFYKLKDSSNVVDWRYNEVGNKVTIDGINWRIIEVEFDFVGWRVKMRGDAE